MRYTLAGLVLIFIFCQRGLTNDFSASRDEGLEHSCNSPGHCSTEDEGPCKDDGKQKLYRWDPVKVCHFLRIISSKQPSAWMLFHRPFLEALPVVISVPTRSDQRQRII